MSTPMRLAIMQPYFLPYLGYWQLMGAVDSFVIYDRIKYTKKGWINRNRLLLNGKPATFSLPLAGASDSTMINERWLAASFNRRKLLSQLDGAYRKAPQFAERRPWLEGIVMHPADNLFDYLYHSIDATRRLLGLDTRTIVSSSVPHDESLKAQGKVLALCAALGATQYINAIGGMELYDSATFNAHAMTLRFLRPLSFEYAQFGAPFVAGLSILDVLMFNSIPETNIALRSQFALVEPGANGNLQMEPG